MQAGGGGEGWAWVVLRLTGTQQNHNKPNSDAKFIDSSYGIAMLHYIVLLYFIYLNLNLN